MHGRLKIKTTAEQEAEKKKERAIKQKKYLGGIDLVFTKRKDSVHDKEALLVSAQLLSVNPDALTLWNIRREMLLAYKSEFDEEEWQKLLEDELKTTEQCLHKNPKSYGAWHHRDWVFKAIPTPPYKEEVELCDRYLQLDERNFHCWDHRRLMVNRSERSLAQELTLTTQLIDKNFSNFSAWHYRSKLLPLVHPPPPGGPHPIPEEMFLKELKRVVTAIFTDPSDQSPWFYLRWLLGQKEEKQRLVQLGLVPLGDALSLVLVFNKELQSTQGLTIHLNGEEMTIKELRPHVNKCIWILPLHTSGNECKLKLSHVEWDDEVDFEIQLDELPVSKWTSPHLLGSRNLSQKSKEALTDIMQNCILLDDLDPGNKWVLLTLVHLMSVLDAAAHQEKMFGYLRQLEDIDPLRLNFYKDFRSKILLENRLQDLTPNSKQFSASNLDLTRVVHPHYLCFVEEFNFDGNKLRSLNSLSSFLTCSTLVLDGTPIHDLSPLKHLLRLRELSLRSCGITSFNILEALADNKCLVNLNIQGNDVTGEVNLEKMKLVIPSLVELKL